MYIRNGQISVKNTIRCQFWLHTYVQLNRIKLYTELGSTRVATLDQTNSNHLNPLRKMPPSAK